MLPAALKEAYLSFPEITTTKQNFIHSIVAPIFRTVYTNNTCSFHANS